MIKPQKPLRRYEQIRVGEDLYQRIATVATARQASIFSVAEEVIDRMLRDAGVPKSETPRATGAPIQRETKGPNLNTNKSEAPQESRAQALRRVGLVADIMRRLRVAEFDVVRVIDTVLLRLEVGRAAYGDLRLAEDKRDFRKEASQELWDLMAYLAIDAVQARDAKVQQILDGDGE